MLPLAVYRAERWIVCHHTGTKETERTGEARTDLEGGKQTLAVCVTFVAQRINTYQQISLEKSAE